MSTQVETEQLLQFGRAVIRIEAAAVEAQLASIDENFARVCRLLLKRPERIIVTGMGKSSYIAGKIAATLASTGSPAFFVHPGEASHGDLGMITAKDVVLAISHSGETTELLTLVPLIKHLKIPLIAMTSHPASSLAQAADYHLQVPVKEEACPLGLAPTASTTATLALGDALAVSLLQARGFNAADFARSHPGGQLGKRLLLKVKDLMRQGPELPKVQAHVSLAEALIEMTRKTLGMTTIVDAEERLLGIYTDGDLRRSLAKALDLHQTTIAEVMNPTPKLIASEALAVTALQQMEDYRITSLVIVDEAHRPQAVLHLHDLLKAGVA